MNIRAYAIVICTLLAARPLAAESIPFEICAESTTWSRPSPEVQAKVWNDERYRDFAPRAYEWTHNFLVIGVPESLSGHFGLFQLSGLWTAEAARFNNCNSDQNHPRNGYEWIEVWVLLHRVVQITHDNNTYTITVEPTGRGFQSVLFRRLNQSVVLRFVTPDGKELQRWDESAPPQQFNNDAPPGTRNIGPNGEIIRK